MQVKRKEWIAYQFDELSDKAKEKARDWWRECEDQDQDVSCTFDDAVLCGGILGIEIGTCGFKTVGGKEGREPAIYYSGFCSQGDGVSFQGTYEYTSGAFEKIREHAPQDEELHRIADALAVLHTKHIMISGMFSSLSATINVGGRGCNSGCMEVNVFDHNSEGDTDSTENEELTQLMRDFADWIYAQLKGEYEWRMADEQVDESIRANEYDFDEDGSRCDEQVDESIRANEYDFDEDGSRC